MDWIGLSEWLLWTQPNPLLKKKFIIQHNPPTPKNRPNSEVGLGRVESILTSWWVGCTPLPMITFLWQTHRPITIVNAVCRLLYNDFYLVEYQKLLIIEWPIFMWYQKWSATSLVNSDLTSSSIALRGRLWMEVMLQKCHSF